MNKSPSETWKSYGDIFEAAAVGRVNAPLLAAIAQAESQGNPLAAPEWRWQFSTDLAELYAPASSAFGIMQISRGTFDLILKTCGKSGEPCPNPDLATRMRVRDSVNLVSGFLQRSMADVLSEKALARISDENLVRLASVIHLCGPEVGKRLVRMGFRINSLPRCGSHWPGVYASRVSELKNSFEILSVRSR